MVVSLIVFLLTNLAINKRYFYNKFSLERKNFWCSGYI